MCRQGTPGQSAGSLGDRSAAPDSSVYRRSIAHCYLGEETNDGLILLPDEQSNHPIGLTVINWWKRFGQGTFPDSLSEIERQIEPWAQKLAA